MKSFDVINIVMSEKKVDVKRVVETIRVLRDTADAFHTENQSLQRENKELRTECTKLRTGQESSIIDNELLFDEISNLGSYVNKWRTNTITERRREEKATSKRAEKNRIRQSRTSTQVS